MTDKEGNTPMDQNEVKNMRNANMQAADMRFANMRRANMRRADMQAADMRFANMRFANMRRADMRNADMRFANMRYADMRYADMREANMRDADMRGADMTNATCQLILRDDGRGYGVHVDHHQDGSYTYRAGCRTGFDIDKAREHWGNPGHPYPEYARRILAAIEWHHQGVQEGRL